MFYFFAFSCIAIFFGVCFRLQPIFCTVNFHLRRVQPPEHSLIRQTSICPIEARCTDAKRACDRASFIRLFGWLDGLQASKCV